MPTDDALLIPDTVAAALAGVSRSTWHVLRAAGRVPPCVRLGIGRRKIVRWRRAEIVAWIEAGCPDAQTWTAMQASAARRLKIGCRANGRPRGGEPAARDTHGPPRVVTA
jgi:predicted DNA-binding transcriptional regulator AlpA